MRIPRFYYPLALQCGQRLELPPELFRHAIQVLRLQESEALLLFNGTGGEYQARLTQVAKRQAQVLIEQFDPVERESPLQLCLVQALIKPDKLDFALQKAVELGMTAFQPLITQRSLVRNERDKWDKKREHWEGVMQSACEQCGRTRLPQLLEPIALEHYLAQPSTQLRLVLDPNAPQRLADLPPAPSAFQVLIGPEGGFSSAEVAACQQAGVQAISLGPRILRAETASISMLTLLQQRYGDL